MSTVIHPGTMIPDALKEFPHLRGILDPYGLKGCGGELGPSESMEFFAKTHGVDQARLLKELNAARIDPSLAPAVDYTPSLADGIYRRFFMGGIAVTLTAGAVWGALLLWRIAFAGAFTALPVNEVNAHGHSQIYGWVGLFIMGYAYQAFPRFKHGSLWKPWLAATSFVLMLGGIVLRVVGEYFAIERVGEQFSLNLPWFLSGAVGMGLEVAAGVLFVVVLGMSYRSIRKPLEVYDHWVFAAAGWFVVSLLFDAFLYYLTSTATSAPELVARVATFQSPLRDIQIYGLAMMMILGVSLRFVPPVFGFRDPGERMYRWLFWPLNVGILASAVLFALMLGTRNFAVFSVPYYVATLLIVVPGLLISWSFGPLGKVTGNDRSVKFIRASHIWLSVSLLMLAFEPFYNRLTGQTFSHAFHGSMRHAITVGFISMSILGVGAKVVANLNGLDTAKLSKLWLPFVLINLGCFLRVSNQVLTDFSSVTFNTLGVSGTLEVTALTLWAIHLMRMMAARQKAGHAMTAETVVVAPQARVAMIVQRWPQTLPVLLKHGFTLLANPVLRNTLARSTTLEQACRFQKVDLMAVLADLQAATRNDNGVRHDAHSCAAPAIDPNLTVAEAARRYPATVPVFSELHLDACCGGADTIANACAHHGLNLDETLARLGAAMKGTR
ncbi:MAG: DUF542 domain-containing protein [Planctomycetes bacterium]|nr:DUF542 domain-containing protein [Planctomycetota bacterium]